MECIAQITAPPKRTSKPSETMCIWYSPLGFFRHLTRSKNFLLQVRPLSGAVLRSTFLPSIVTSYSAQTKIRVSRERVQCELKPEINLQWTQVADGTKSKSTDNARKPWLCRAFVQPKGEKGDRWGGGRAEGVL